MVHYGISWLFAVHRGSLLTFESRYNRCIPFWTAGISWLFMVHIVRALALEIFVAFDGLLISELLFVWTTRFGVRRRTSTDIWGFLISEFFVFPALEGGNYSAVYEYLGGTHVALNAQFELYTGK